MLPSIYCSVANAEKRSGMLLKEDCNASWPSQTGYKERRTQLQVLSPTKNTFCISSLTDNLVQ